MQIQHKTENPPDLNSNPCSPLLCVYHGFRWLLVDTKLLTAKLHSRYVKSEILGGSELESDILPPTPQPWFVLLEKLKNFVDYLGIVQHENRIWHELLNWVLTPEQRI